MHSRQYSVDELRHMVFDHNVSNDDLMNHLNLALDYLNFQQAMQVLNALRSQRYYLAYTYGGEIYRKWPQEERRE